MSAKVADVIAEITGPLLLENFLVDPGPYQVTAKDGIVTLAGTPETDTVGQEIIRAVRHLDGVVAVRDRLDYLSAPPVHIYGSLT
jgi:osmotically-inducible protein OsmY